MDEYNHSSNKKQFLIDKDKQLVAICMVRLIVKKNAFRPFL